MIIRPLLECKGVVEKYGKKHALNDLNLNVQSGQIRGLLGSNGAEKTTLMKLIVSLLRDYRGSIQINGIKPGVKSKQIVAYLPDREFLYQ
ncbi:ATP-binding cassette domain-containing protein [Paenibacillus sp. NPDC057934]|uniref:ATP-binding cassette domain-containing protein n=1 Tax=Paenibacillus sp. NPDC057934 TaxID=3346282 RepID=UPI0036DF263F